MLLTSTPFCRYLVSTALFFFPIALVAVQAPQNETIRVEVSLITVGVRVTDARGREKTDLLREDFQIFEDGVAQDIVQFSSEEQPVSLGILLDRSDSMRFEDKFERAKAAADMLLDASHRDSEFFFIPFDATWSRARFTSDRKQVKYAVDATQLGHGTALYDAILDALEQSRESRYGRQVLVVISDGADQHSTHRLNNVINALQESRVQLYAIGYYGRVEDEVFRSSGEIVELAGKELIDNPRAVFRQLAEKSGAESFFPRSDNALVNAIQRIVRDLRTQYTLAYYPSNRVRDNRFRKILVRVGPRGLRVRARQGYILPAATGVHGTSPNPPD
jgi:Ca-activated chloride channel homolog